MKLAALTITLLISFAACSTTIVPISGTPTADQVLSNARRVARDLDSYRSVRSTVETTHYPQRPARDVSSSTTMEIEVAAGGDYRVLNHDDNFEYFRSSGNDYFRSETGRWEIHQVDKSAFDLLPGEVSTMPPAHPLEWLDKRNVIGMTFTGEIDLDDGSVYVVEGLIPMFSSPQPLDLRIPSDNVRLYIDKRSFEVLRIEIDHNIRDSLREDSGYQVIPGVVEIKTLEILEYSDHNAEIEITIPDTAPAA